MIKLGTEASARALLAMICDGQLGNTRDVDSFHLSRQFARLGEEFPAIKDEMLQRYERMGPGPAKPILESALIEFADPAVIHALIRGHAADGQHYNGRLSHALRRVALGQRPVEGMAMGGGVHNGRCRMHGGPNPGAPKGNQRAFKHGRYSVKAIARRRGISALLRMMRRSGNASEERE